MHHVCSYLETSKSVLESQASEALQHWTDTSIHQARVITRRLEAALTVLEPIIPPAAGRRVVKATHRLRRRLGAYRDLDVQRAWVAPSINVVNEELSPNRLCPSDATATAAMSCAALRWLDKHLAARQDALRQKSSEKALSKFQRRMRSWPQVLRALNRNRSQISQLIASAVRKQFLQFASQADQHLNLGDPRPDLHELRKTGKTLRYSLELLDYTDIKLPTDTLKHFKRIQDSLGVWHDRLIFTQTALDLVRTSDLASRDGRLAADLLDRCALSSREAAAAIEGFVCHWANYRDSIRESIFVATTGGAGSTERRTTGITPLPEDPCPPSTTSTEPAAASSPGASEAPGA